jgi:hypothetical protein
VNKSHLPHAILQAAKSAGPAGMSTSDVTGYTVKSVDNAARRMVADGVLFSAHYSRHVRYFVDRGLAVAFEAAHQRPAVVHVRATRAAWAPPPKGVITPVEGITAKTRVVVAAPLPDRGFHTDTHAR